MRGEKSNKMSAATIVDLHGVPKYHVVPTKLITFGLLSMALVVVVTIILGFMVIFNKYEIDRLDNRITVEETK